LIPAFGTPHRPLVSRRAALALLAGTLCAGGCGLSEYEGQMATEAQRVQRFDEEMKYLGAPLDPPKIKSGNKEVDPPALFLRPPKGIVTEPDTNLGPPPYARYIARSGAKSTERAGVTDMYLALAPEGQKEFATAAVQALAQVSGVKARTITKQPPDTDPLTFSAYENSGAGFFLYICQSSGYQLAIGYQTDKTASATKAVDLSVESLVVEGRAAKLRKAYEQRVRSHK
jgi:hypothetical protein